MEHYMLTECNNTQNHSKGFTQPTGIRYAVFVYIDVGYAKGNRPSFYLCTLACIVCTCTAFIFQNVSAFELFFFIL